MTRRLLDLRNVTITLRKTCSGVFFVHGIIYILLENTKINISMQTQMVVKRKMRLPKASDQSKRDKTAFQTKIIRPLVSYTSYYVFKCFDSRGNKRRSLENA